jgi:hypothetical protein
LKDANSKAPIDVGIYPSNQIPAYQNSIWMIARKTGLIEAEIRNGGLQPNAIECHNATRNF